LSSVLRTNAANAPGEPMGYQVIGVRTCGES
jgi:hypothetical protein